LRPTRFFNPPHVKYASLPNPHEALALQRYYDTRAGEQSPSGKGKYHSRKSCASQTNRWTIRLIALVIVACKAPGNRACVLNAFLPRRIVLMNALVIALLASPSTFAQTPQRIPRDVRPPVEIRTDAVELFYGIYDAARGVPNADALQHGYFDAGSDGARQFIPNRIKSAEALAQRCYRWRISPDGSVSFEINERVSIVHEPALRGHITPATGATRIKMTVAADGSPSLDCYLASGSP
jgi:hypothetical protein